MWAVGRQWGIRKSKSGRYAYDTRTRGEWCHDCARESTHNGQRAHAARCTVLLRKLLAFYGRAKSRARGAH